MARVLTDEQKARAKKLRKERDERRRKEADKPVTVRRGRIPRTKTTPLDPGALVEKEFAKQDELLQAAGDEIKKLEARIAQSAQAIGVLRTILAATQDRYIASLIEGQRLTFDQGAARLGEERANVERQLQAIAGVEAQRGLLNPVKEVN